MREFDFFKNFLFSHHDKKEIHDKYNWKIISHNFSELIIYNFNDKK